MYLIKYLKRTSLHIGLCLLLTCFANVASAQFEFNLVNLQQNGLTIRFDVTFGTTVTGVQRVLPTIQINNINSEDIESFMAQTNYQCESFTNFRIFPSRKNTVIYQFCMGEGTRETLELKLNNPDMRKNITITSGGGISMENLPPGSTFEFGIRNILRLTVNPVVLIRSKVFLEGPLQ